MASASGGAATPRTHTLSHQNVELRRGRHGSPAEGACVVELASMLGGERFSDHPHSVCPVIASYMRTLNDALGEEDRQDLYRYAAEIHGTRGDRATRRERARACARWSREMGAVLPWQARPLGLWRRDAALGAICAKAALAFGGPSLAMALADGLIAMGRDEGAALEVPVEDLPEVGSRP